MARNTLTLHEAAESLGVHYMTVYRYVRLGMLPAEKVGPSWQVTAADLADFTSKPKAKRGEADWKSRFHARALAGDEAGAWGVIEAALASGVTPRDVYLKIIAPAMRDIGEAWHNNELGIAAEHRATAITQRLAGRLGQHMIRRGVPRGKVVIAAPEGERHDLPLTMIGDLLRSEGYEVMNLGCDLPAEAIAEAVAETRDAVVGLSVSGPIGRKNLKGAVAAVKAVDASIRVMVGGAAADEQLARAAKADHFVAGIDDALEVLASS